MALDAQDGVDQTGVVSPTGAVGIRGWLSAIYNILATGVLSIVGHAGAAFDSPNGTGTPANALYAGGRAVSTAPTVVVGNISPLTTDTGGNLRCNVTQPVTGFVVDISTQTGANVTAKGTQGTNFLDIQQAKDSGRTSVILSIAATGGGLIEALYTMTTKKGTAATGSSTSYTVAAGKTLRIQSMFISIRNINTAAVTYAQANLRMGAASGGAVSATSDLMAQVSAGIVLGTATLGNSAQQEVNFPDGLEIPAAQNIGIGVATFNVDCNVNVLLLGYEY